MLSQGCHPVGSLGSEPNVSQQRPQKVHRTKTHAGSRAAAGGVYPGVQRVPPDHSLSSPSFAEGLRLPGLKSVEGSFQL